MTSDPGRPPDASVADADRTPQHTPAHQEPHAPQRQDAVKQTRAAALWTGIILGLLVLIVLLIFITQNMDPVTTVFLGWRVGLPLGITVLIAAIAGALLTALVGVVRMVQLRRAARKNLRG